MNNFIAMQCHNCPNNEYNKFKRIGRDYICNCCGSWYRDKDNHDNHCESGYAMIKAYSFDAAKEIFQNALSENPNNIDALWGWLLAEYRIRYVKGFYNDDVEPIYCFDKYEMFHTRSLQSEVEYRKILSLLANYTDVRNSYREKAEKIDRSIESFRNCKSKTDNDVFICVKISTSTEKIKRPRDEKTKDFEIAEKLYKDLKAKGKKPFFSFYTLKNQVNSDDLIWTNLVKSKKMVLIGSQKDYFDSVWVKSEWKRWLFLDRINDLYILTLPQSGQSPYDIIPTELSKNQIYTQSTYNKLLHDICENKAVAPVSKKRNGGKLFIGIMAILIAGILGIGAIGKFNVPFLSSSSEEKQQTNSINTPINSIKPPLSTNNPGNNTNTQSTNRPNNTTNQNANKPNNTTSQTTSTPHIHSFGDWFVYKNPTCINTGTERQSCDCGYYEERTLNITNHNYAPATCTVPQMCIDCGKTFGNLASHEYNAATCTSPQTCKNCNHTTGEKLGHLYSNDICARCGETDPDSLFENLYVIDSYFYYGKTSNFTDTYGNTYNIAYMYDDGNWNKAEVNSTHNLNKKYSSISGSIVEGKNLGLTVKVEILVDNKVVFSKSNVTKTTGKIDFSLDITNASTIQIRIRGDANMQNDRVHMALVDVKLTK